MSVVRSVALTCHPATGAVGVRGVEVGVRREADGGLALTFRLDGDLAGVRVPAPGVPRVGQRLWEHTCFEVFVAVDGAPAYHELNFAPSGEWAGYAFRSYRDAAGVVDEGLAPGIAVRSGGDRLELDALVALARLSPEHASAVLRVGLSAVIEATDGTLSYWALRHPASRPDFHHAEARALRLEPPRREW